MKLVTKETDYAIRAVLYLARQPKRYVSSREIAEKDHIPLRFLRRILAILKKNEVIDTKEGAVGGVRLKRKPEKLSLTHLITLFQGPIQLTECLFRKELCHNRENCVLRKRILEIERKVDDEFKQITIADLLKGTE